VFAWVTLGCGIACTSETAALPLASDFLNGGEDDTAAEVDTDPVDSADPAHTGVPDSGEDDTASDDADGDGYLPPEDCDDTDPLVSPEAEEICDNGQDDNCDGLSCRWDGAGIGRLTGGRNDSAGVGVAVGDFSGDGAPDVIIGAPDATGSSRAGRVWVWSGTSVADASLESSATDLGPSDGADGAGRIVVVPGDLSGDRMVDLVVGTNHVPGESAGRLSVLLGPLVPDTRLAEPDAWIELPLDLDLLLFPAGGPATDSGSGLLLGAPAEGGGVVRLLEGSWSGLRTLDEATVTWTAAAGQAGRAVLSGGDLNGDGLDDVLIGVPGSEQAGLFFGPHASGAVEDADAWLGVASTNGGLGTSLALPGDVDGDGAVDVLVAEAVDAGDRGLVVLFCGGDRAECARWTGAVDNDQLGHALTSVHDTEGDGHAEVVLTAHGSGTMGLWFGPIAGSHTLETADVSVTLGGQAGFSIAASSGRLAIGAPTLGSEDPPTGGAILLDFPSL